MVDVLPTIFFVVRSEMDNQPPPLQRHLQGYIYLYYMHQALETVPEQVLLMRLLVVVEVQVHDVQALELSLQVFELEHYPLPLVLDQVTVMVLDFRGSKLMEHDHHPLHH
jgi:hypothetical protein